MCDKEKFTKLEAMIYLANSDLIDKIRKGRTKRKECRYYYCDECKAYHLTSMSKIEFENWRKENERE